jgi:hypothetical protein
MRKEQNDGSERRAPVADQQLAKIEIFREHQPLLRHGDFKQAAVTDAFVGLGCISHVMTSRPKRRDNCFRTALVG